MLNRTLTYVVYTIFALCMSLSGVQAELLRNAETRTDDGVLEIVICTNAGKQTITLDQNGNPIEQDEQKRSCCQDSCTACGMCQPPMAVSPQIPQVITKGLLTIDPLQLREVTVVNLTQAATARAPPGGKS